jgi:hypothetical protein
VPAQLENDLLAKCAVALETSADATLISGMTSGRIYGLWLPDGRERIDLATAHPERVSRAMTRTRRPEFRAHRYRLGEGDRTVFRGLAIMTISRTWLDLARTLELPDLVAAGDSALRLGCTLDEFADVLGRCPRARGARRARAALPLLDERSRSRPESHLRVALAAPDLPKLEVNEPVFRDNGRGWLAEPDLSLRAAKIALEYQGIDHASAPRMRKDITRDVDMRREGWEVRAFGPAEVFGSPWQIAPELRALIRKRAPHLLRPRRP